MTLGADLDFYKAYTNTSPTDEEATQIGILLSEAEEVILSYTKGIWNTPSGSSITSDTLQCRMVRRYFENQLGYTSETVDGLGYSAANVTDGIVLTDADKQRLIYAGVKVSTSVLTTWEMNRNAGYVF